MQLNHCSLFILSFVSLAFSIPLSHLDGTCSSNNPTLETCNVDITIMVDMSTSMISTGNVIDISNDIVKYFLPKFNYSQTKIALITYGNPGIARSEYFDSYVDVCKFMFMSMANVSEMGIYSVQMIDAFQTYLDNINFYKRSNPSYLILLTHNANEKEIQTATPNSLAIRQAGVTILTIGLNTTDQFLSDLSDKLYHTHDFAVPNNITDDLTSTICASQVPPISDAIGTPCSNNSKNAWLDVILCVDISNAMFVGDLTQAAGQLATLFRGFTIGQEPQHSTRVGIITFGTLSVIRNELKDVTNFEDLQQQLFSLRSYRDPADTGGNLQGALQDAAEMLANQGGYRKRVIFVYSAIYNDQGFDDPVPAATALKDDGVTIVTMSFTASNGVPPYGLSALASPGYSFYSNDTGIVTTFSQAMAQVNCYCPHDTLQFTITDYESGEIQKYADCIAGYDTPAFPSLATRVCNELDSIPVTITSQAKMDFITDQVNPHDLNSAKDFICGAHYSSTLRSWAWYHYDGSEVALGQYPELASEPQSEELYGYMKNFYGFNWELLPQDDTVARMYVCQSRACDADNICLKTTSKRAQYRKLMAKLMNNKQ